MCLRDFKLDCVIAWDLSCQTQPVFYTVMKGINARLKESVHLFNNYIKALLWSEELYTCSPNSCVELQRSGALRWQLCEVRTFTVRTREV